MSSMCMRCLLFLNHHHPPMGKSSQNWCTTVLLISHQKLANNSMHSLRVPFRPISPCLLSLAPSYIHTLTILLSGPRPPSQALHAEHGSVKEDDYLLEWYGHITNCVVYQSSSNICRLQCRPRFQTRVSWLSFSSAILTWWFCTVTTLHCICR